MVGIIYTLCLNTLAARAAPKGLEGAIYGLVMATITLAGVFSGIFGNFIYDFFGPKHGHSVTYGWNASLIFGLIFTILGGILIPFMPAWTRSRRPLSEMTEPAA
jgi:MFS family permease